MIAVGVGDDDSLQSADGLLPEKGGDDPFSHIKGGGEGPTAVQKELPVARQAQERGTALADIEKGQLAALCELLEYELGWQDEQDDDQGQQTQACAQ